MNTISSIDCPCPCHIPYISTCILIIHIFSLISLFCNDARFIGSDTCFYGRCMYCKSEKDGVCGHGTQLEGVVVLWIPTAWPLGKVLRHPWGRSYRDGVTRRYVHILYYGHFNVNFFFQVQTLICVLHMHERHTIMWSFLVMLNKPLLINISILMLKSRSKSKR